MKHLRKLLAAARAAWRKARARLRSIRDKISQARPGSERREKLRRQQDWWKAALERRDKLRDELVRELRRSRQKVNTSPGAPHWGGCRDIIDRVVVPIIHRHGWAITSRKRPANDPLSLANPGSEHNMANVLSDAIDAGTANNYAGADEIGNALGVGDVADYVFEFFDVDGHTYRVQIIAGTHGTGPHLHTGLTRID